MTQEEKQLLLKDIFARVSYGVICQFIWTYSNETTDGEDVITKRDDIIRCIDVCTEEIQANYYGEWVDLEHCKPYLRPMSSMTEEEKEEFDKVLKSCNDKVFACPEKERRYKFFDAEQEDFMNAHHFDYRGLIPMGLALEALEGMYKTE